METPPPNDSLKAPISPSVGGRLCSFRKDKQKANRKMLKQRVKHYYRWLCSTFITKPKISQSSPDSLRMHGPSKRSSSGLLYPVSSVKERYRKGGKCKISRVLQSPVSGPQASPKVEASDRSKQAQHLPTSREVKMEIPESIRASLIPGEWVSSIDLRIPIHPNSSKYPMFCHDSQVF